MNMLRLPGSLLYETPLFHELCDELGVLVWQDFMFANLDYPSGDEPFLATVRAEAQRALAGGSCVAHQAIADLDRALEDLARTEKLVAANAAPAIELLCPNDQSNYQGAVVPLVATAI